MTPNIQTLRRKQFDQKLKSANRLRNYLAIENGWIRTVRELLGMTTAQLARRAKMSQPNVTQTEVREQEGTVSLNSLKKLADALQCDFVYGFIPRKQLSQTVHEQALKAAQKIAWRTSHSMNLEAQSTSTHMRSELVEKIADELLKSRTNKIWDEE